MPIMGGMLSGYDLGSPTKGALIFGLRTSLPAIPVMHGRGDQGETPTRAIQSAPGTIMSPRIWADIGRCGA